MKISMKQFVTCGISLLALAHISSAHADGCSVKSLAGEWAYSEQGATKLVTNPSVPSTSVPSVTLVPSYPFSEVGWFQINVSHGSNIGTGTGEAFLSVNGDPIPVAASSAAATVGIPLKIQNVQVNANCIGIASFIAGTDPRPRTITFTLFSSSKFQYISTFGDITTLGTAVKR